MSPLLLLATAVSLAVYVLRFKASLALAGVAEPGLATPAVRHLRAEPGTARLGRGRHPGAAHRPLAPREIEAEFHKLAVLVEKTGGPRGHEVLTLLQRRVRREAEA